MNPITTNKKTNIMKFGKRNFRFRGGSHVSESRMMTISFIIGIAIIALLIYLF